MIRTLVNQASAEFPGRHPNKVVEATVGYRGSLRELGFTATGQAGKQADRCNSHRVRQRCHDAVGR